MKNEIVIYQSGDGLVKMEALVDTANETVWATQKAMAQLFGVSVPNISYHFKKIFSSGELDAQTVIKEILITAQSGVRGVSEEKVRYYNLDAILSLGYRVNSVQATAFRKWATSVLKQYMMKGYAVNHNAVSEQKVSDPNVIGSKTGHVEGCRVFARYRTVEEGLKKSLVDILG